MSDKAQHRTTEDIENQLSQIAYDMHCMSPLSADFDALLDIRNDLVAILCDRTGESPEDAWHRCKMRYLSPKR